MRKIRSANTLVIRTFDVILGNIRPDPAAQPLQTVQTERHPSPIDALRLRDRPAVVALLLANLVPIVGVVVFDWDLANVMVLYWAESAVIGAYNVLKMITFAGLRAIPLALFFTVHYGIFMTVHLAFILVFSQPGGIRGDSMGGSPFRAMGDHMTLGFAIAVASLLLSHGVSFVVHFLRGPERPKKLNDLMGAPYVRIVVMHVTLIFGAGLTLALGSNVALLVLLVGLKVAADLWSHRREHRKAARAA